MPKETSLPAGWVDGVRRGTARSLSEKYLGDPRHLDAMLTPTPGVEVYSSLDREWGFMAVAEKKRFAQVVVMSQLIGEMLPPQPRAQEGAVELLSRVSMRPPVRLAAEQVFIETVNALSADTPLEIMESFLSVGKVLAKNQSDKVSGFTEIDQDFARTLYRLVRQVNTIKGTPLPEVSNMHVPDRQSVVGSLDLHGFTNQAIAAVTGLDVKVVKEDKYRFKKRRERWFRPVVDFIEKKGGLGEPYELPDDGSEVSLRESITISPAVRLFMRGYPFHVIGTALGIAPRTAEVIVMGYFHDKVGAERDMRSMNRQVDIDTSVAELIEDAQRKESL